jgi:hypothetical protein
LAPALRAENLVSMRTPDPVPRGAGGVCVGAECVGTLPVEGVAGVVAGAAAPPPKLDA